MLTEEKRQQLDTIVSQMTQNRETNDSIQFVVNDFKNRHSTEEPSESFLEKTGKVLDMFFGGGKVGEAIGTKIAKIKAKPEEKEFIAPGPTAGQIAGSALQSAALFTPIGGVAKGITAGARGLDLIKGVSALGKIGSGALAGELFDVASNLQQGKTGKEALTPGLGTLIGGGIPALGVTKNVLVRFGERQAPRIINSLIKPLAKDFSYGKNPGRAVAEEGIVANNFDDLIDKIRASRQKIGKSIGNLSSNLSEKPLLNIESALSPLDDATKVAAKQNNPTLLNRLNNVKRAITDVLEPVADDAGNLGIKSVGRRNLDTLTFKQTRNILSDIGDMTQFTGNPSDDKLVNSALKKVYGSIKATSLKYAEAVNPELAKEFSVLTEKYADLHSAEIAAKYRDKIVERQNLIGFSPQNVGIGTGLITAIATGGATIPSVVVGLSAATIDKLASTPGFKTRLAYLLSKKTHREVSFLFQKIPALSKFFSTEKGVFPGDIILGENGEVLSRKIGEFIKKPKIGLSTEDITKTPFAGFKSLTQEARKYKSAEEFVKAKIGNKQPVFHGTTEVIEGDFKYPLYLTKDKVYAEHYATNKSASSITTYAKKGGGEKVYEFYPKDPKRVLDIRKSEHAQAIENYWRESVSGQQVPTKTGLPDWTEGESLAQFIEENKLPFDSVLVDEGGIQDFFTQKIKHRGVGFVAINKDALLTKSQLTDLWNKAVAGTGNKGFQGFKDLTTKFLDYAKGKTTLSRQEILDFAKRPELKKGEADLLMRKLEEFEPKGIKAYHGAPKELQELGFGEGVRSNEFLGNYRKVKSGAIFFTPDEQTAKFFAGNRAEYLQDIGEKGIKPTVYERYLDIKKSLDLTDINKADEALLDAGIDLSETKMAFYGKGEEANDLKTFAQMHYETDKEALQDLWKLFDEPKVVEQLKKAGYDGAKLFETGDRGISYAVFDPKQAKQALSKILAQEFADSIRRDLLEKMSKNK